MFEIDLLSDDCSRLEDEARTLTAQVRSHAPLAAPTTLDVDLVRTRPRDTVVATERVELSPQSRSARVRFDLETLVDASSSPRVRRGRYRLRARTVGAAAAVVESRELRVRLVTARRLARDYLHGLSRLPADELGLRLPPRALTGIEVVDIHPETPPGFHPLALQVDSSGARALKWRGGSTVAIDPTERRYVLPDGHDGWIELEADPAALPDRSIQESLLVERRPLDEKALGRTIDRATDWLEHTMLHVFLEPTRIATDPDPDADLLVPPLTLYARAPGAWPSLKFPYAHVDEVHWLAGHVGGQRVIEIPRAWLQIQRSGFASLVPSGDPLLLTCLPFLSGLLGGAIEIPGFWHFSLRAGLRALPDDLVDAIAKKAAIDALVRIGQAHKPGIGSESFSKELSVSVSYVRNAQANLLGATRAEYQADLADLIPRLRARYLGLATTLVI